MTAPVPPAATRRIVTERRQRPLRAGIGLAIAAVVMLAIGGILAFAATALEVGTGERASLGNEVALESDAREYGIVLIDPPLIDAESFRGMTVDIACEVTNAGATRSVERSSGGGLRGETDVGLVFAAFDAMPGPTTVRCDWKDGRVERAGIFYAVGTSHRTLDMIGLVLLGLGMAAGLLAVSLIIIGWRGRQVIVRT